MADLYLWDETSPTDIILRTSAADVEPVAPTAAQGGRRVRNLGSGGKPTRRWITATTHVDLDVRGTGTTAAVHVIAPPTSTGAAVSSEAVAPPTATGAADAFDEAPAPTHLVAAASIESPPRPVSTGLSVDPDEDDLLLLL